MQVSDSISNNPANSLQGLGKTCMYCGDGINDLAALAAADVGMAVGASDASAAATLSDTHYSIAGKPGQPLQYKPLLYCIGGHSCTCLETSQFLVCALGVPWGRKGGLWGEIGVKPTGVRIIFFPMQAFR